MKEIGHRWIPMAEDNLASKAWVNGSRLAGWVPEIKMGSPCRFIA
jgi:hypothetical protein